MEKKTIGGQAVLEGVMLRDAESGRVATANRRSNGKIVLTRSQGENAENRPKWKNIPLVRGGVSLIESMFTGTKVLMDSAEVLGEDLAEAEEPSKFERYLSEKLHVKLETVVSVVAIIMALGLALVLFVFLTTGITGFLASLFQGKLFESGLFKSVIEGVVKLVIFISYLLLVSLMKDIKRTFSYHGAEHKTINCYESDLEMTVENVRKSSRVHPRCGTSFLFFVLAVSIILNSFLPFGEGMKGSLLRMVLKLLLLPLVAGISYEIIRFAGKSKSKLVRALISPGLLMQKITTREPDDQMIEVALASFHGVLDPDYKIEYPEDEEAPLQETAEAETAQASEPLAEAETTEASEPLAEAEEAVEKHDGEQTDPAGD